MIEGKTPVDSVDFWRERIYRTIATGGMLHQIIWNDSYDLWAYSQGEWAGRLIRLIPSAASVLDAGCGYGAMVCCLQMATLIPGVRYVGVDSSPDLIRLANYRYPEQEFHVADLRCLPFPSRSFDWAICRSMERMIVDNCGPEAWAAMRREIGRVANKVIVGDYPTMVGGPIEFRVETG